MLEVATAASTGMGKSARWLHARWACFNNGDDIAPDQALFNTGYFYFDYLTRNRMAHKYDGTFMAGNEMAPVGYLLDFYPKNLANLERFSL
jgi:hypothetical protein